VILGTWIAPAGCECVETAIGDHRVRCDQQRGLFGAAFLVEKWRWRARRATASNVLEEP
jgi:hypothetical protein